MQSGADAVLAQVRHQAIAIWVQNHVEMIRVSPVFTLNLRVSRALAPLSGCGLAPERARTIMRAKSSNVTIVEMGLPGSPKK